MILKNRLIGQRKRRIILVFIASTLLAAISIPFAGSMFRSLAAIPFGPTSP